MTGISCEEYQANIDNYCEQVNYSTDPEVFVIGFRKQLTSGVLSVDSFFTMSLYTLRMSNLLSESLPKSKSRREWMLLTALSNWRFSMIMSINI